MRGACGRGAHSGQENPPAPRPKVPRWLPRTPLNPQSTRRWNNTGATANTWGTSASFSPNLMGIGAEVKLKIYEAPGGCTSTSAPIPPTRLLLSSSSPVVIPTTSSTIPTSMAAARMLTTVRTGRWSTFSMIILLTTRPLRLRAGRQIHKLRLLGLFEQEFFGLNRLVERGLLDRNRQAVVFDRAVEVYAGRIADALEVPVLGVLNALGVAALRPINLHTRNFEARPVHPDLPPAGQVPTGGGLEHLHDVVTAASFFGLFGEDLFSARGNGRDQQKFHDVLRGPGLQRGFGRSA